MNWRLNKIQYPIYNLGHGKRMGIWVQGCDLKCKACINENIWSENGGEKVDLLYLFNWLLLKAEAFEGITITGGEPFRQYEQLISFLHLIKTKTRLNVVCFSGFYLHELYAKFPDKLFTKYIDILVDGRFVDKHKEENNTKGSSNQTVYKFINQIPYIEDKIEFSKQWSLNIGENGSVYMSGIPKPGEIDKLCSELEEHGINKTFR